jgi:fido (protein-threonine AMPylation protein)
MDRNQFCELMAQFFVDVNKLHPFREGNGRTQQTFRTTDLYKVPSELIREIFTACDLDVSTASEASSSES